MAVGDFSNPFGQGLAGLAQQQMVAQMAAQKALEGQFAPLRQQIDGQMARLAIWAQQNQHGIVLGHGGIVNNYGRERGDVIKMKPAMSPTFHSCLRAEIEAWLPKLS